MFIVLVLDEHQWPVLMIVQVSLCPPVAHKCDQTLEIAVARICDPLVWKYACHTANKTRPDLVGKLQNFISVEQPPTFCILTLYDTICW